MALEQLSNYLAGIPNWVIIIASIWTIAWTGLALWKAARLNNQIWFVVLLVVNTLGILEILYLFIFSKRQPRTSKKQSVKKKQKADYNEIFAL